jgi:inorganic pyrophosphatase/exopolyphosphatase
MTEEIAYLLIGPIVFDTVDFSSTAGKTTDKDRQIYVQLQTFLQSPIDHSKLYSDLREHASDITGMKIVFFLLK